MRIAARIRSWLSAILHRLRTEREMDAELRFHLESRAEDLVRAGLPREDALRRARIEFGAIESTKEECREARGSNLLESLMQDLRFGLRMLRKSPGFTAVAVLTLALGIGANTAIFSIVNAVILRPLPYKDSSRMFEISTHTPMFPTFSLGLTWPAFQEIRSQASALEHSSAYVIRDKTFTGNGDPSLLKIVGISGGFFEEMGARARLGRLFTEQDHAAAQNRVLVLSEAVWRTRFGSDPSILGRTLLLDKEPWTVVGVADRGFAFPEGAEAWAPLSLSAEEKTNQSYFMLQVIGKLRRDRTIQQLNSQLAAIAQRIVVDHPELGKGYGFSARNLLELRVADIRTAYYLLLGAATMVLLICCANLASLLLSRGTGRSREMAVRAALGASRFRLLRQGIVESCLLALLGGGVGAFLAAGGVQLFRHIAPASTPRLSEVSVDFTLLWFSFLSSLVAGIIFGLAPARRAARMFPGDALKQGSGAGLGAARTAAQTRLGNALVVVEVALAFVLLVGSALMTQTVSRLLHQNPGFRTDHLLSFDLPQPPILDEASAEKELNESLERLDRIFDRLGHIPGVSAVTASSHGLLGGMSMMMSGLRVEGAVPASSGDTRHAIARLVDPTYFRALGIPLLRGREFTAHPADRKTKEVIVNEGMARAYWGTLDVLGKHISMSQDNKGNPEWSEVIGVVADSRDVEISSRPSPEYYVSLRTTTNGALTLFVRTENDPDAVAGTVSRELWQLFPDQPITHLSTVTRIISESISDRRMDSILLAVFAGIGFALALIGVYGVISFTVSRRVQEIGIRMALGARSSAVLRMILLQGLLLVAAGVALGAAAAFGLGRAIASLLYGISPTDPVSFLGVSVLLTAVALLASYIPARRAARVDPMVALRYE